MTWPATSARPYEEQVARVPQRHLQPLLHALQRVEHARHQRIPLEARRRFRAHQRAGEQRAAHELVLQLQLPHGSVVRPELGRLQEVYLQRGLSNRRGAYLL